MVSVIVLGKQSWRPERGGDSAGCDDWTVAEEYLCAKRKQLLGRRVRCLIRNPMREIAMCSRISK